MKKIFSTAIIALVALFANAQAHLTITEFQKIMQPGIETTFPFVEKTVEKAIDEKMQKMGYKGKETKGFIVYRGVKTAELGPDMYDLYFKTDRKSRKEKETSIVTMLISSGLDKFIGDSTSTIVVERGKKFLDGLAPNIVAYDLELQITDQEDALKKAEKKMKNLTEDGEDLVKKKAKLENEIEENIKKKADQVKEVEKQKQVFETLKAKRKQ